MKVDMLQNLYEIICESGLLIGMEIRRIDRGGKEWIVSSI
jgi:hypothetical protein